MSAYSAVRLGAYQLDGQAVVYRWQAIKSEDYSVNRVRGRLRDLAIGALVYANDHEDRFPTFASDLFAAGDVDDPASFYNPGDGDAPPLTIDNDVPDGLNSARVSFDFPSAGGGTGDPPGNVLFTDNSVANNAGLGWCQAYVDGHTAFVPVWPHPFMDIHVPVYPNSLSRIARGPDGTWEPHALTLPGDAAVEVRAAPHSWHLLAEGSLGAEILDQFGAEGFDVRNRYEMRSNGGLVLNEAEVVGPAGGDQPLVVYAQFEAVLTRTPADLADYDSAMIMLSWSDGGGPQVMDFATVTLTQNGLYATPGLHFAEERTLGPADAGYVSGAVTVYVRGIAQLTIGVPVAVGDSWINLFGNALAHQEVPAGSAPGRFGSAALDVALPTTAAVDQVKVYLPPGYDLFVPDGQGPGDVVLACLRGDHDLNYVVDAGDRNAFIAGYSRPLVSAHHVPASFAYLQTFDFDGDADLDCADYAALKAAWSGGGSPAYFAACDVDADGDGAADGDDDCPSTPAGVSVDARGCPQGDLNADGQVGHVDWAAFAGCMSGPWRRPTPTPPVTVSQCLNAFDLDSDNDVDLVDFAGFQRAPSFGS